MPLLETGSLPIKNEKRSRQRGRKRGKSQFMRVRPKDTFRWGQKGGWGKEKRRAYQKTGKVQ